MHAACIYLTYYQISLTGDVKNLTMHREIIDIYHFFINHASGIFVNKSNKAKLNNLISHSANQTWVCKICRT